MLRTAAMVTVVLALAACGGATTTEPSTTEAEPSMTNTTPLPTGGLDVIVPPEAEGDFPADLTVSCSNGRFPIGALREIRSLEQVDPGGVAEAIAPFLANEEGRQWPQHGWQVLHRSDDEIQLVAKRADGLLAFMTVSNDGSGWTWASASLPGDPCELEFTVPDHLNTVEWRLDPDGAGLTAESTAIPVILQERECVSGQEIGDRLVGPQIVMTETQVFVAFAAQRPQGAAFDCQGNPTSPFVVELPEPIGDRQVVEGLEIGIDLADYVD